MSSSTTSPKRQPSRAASRRSKLLPAMPKAKPGLAVDTSVSRHRAPAPQQIFPQDVKRQELSFISLADIKALKKQKSADQARQKQLETVQAQALQRSFSADNTTQTSNEDVPPPYTRGRTTGNMQPPAMHKRIKGLRPTPLDLATDISPSDRAITIGISVDPTNVSTHARTPSSPAAPRRRPFEKHHGQEAVTPTIVITPAKEDFDFEFQPTTYGHRPTSSIYSRNTNCMPVDGHTPPVPPLPLFAADKASHVRESDGTNFEESLKVPKRGREKNLSVCTVFEEDQSTIPTPKRMTSYSTLPTPRRSRGWWNLITSPFSAGSAKSTAFFWRSPSPKEESDRSRILADISEAGDDSHAGIIFMNRTPEDVDLRSAPPLDSRENSLEGARPRQPPKRSNTAPSALDRNGRDGVDIYHIPYVGAAADYYNPHKNFPSMISNPADDIGADRGLEGWSPSQSVYREPRGSVKAVNVGPGDGDDGTGVGGNPFDDDQHASSRALDDEKSPFSDAHASNAFEGFSGTHPAAGNGFFFTTPAADELRGASPIRAEPSRNDTQGTEHSYFSPLTATPVIEKAQMGTLMGPSVVDVRGTPGRPATATHSPYTSGLGVVTMASRGIEDEERAVSEKAPFRHQRNDSYGLGIETDDRSLSSEKALFPPPRPLAEQPRLGTDRFGQLRIEEQKGTMTRTCSERQAPWYRRFLCPLIGLLMGLVLLFVVLMVLFIPQGHADMPVQAQWLNLTGFPAMPTGVATVVQPKAETEENGCVKPDGLWNCAVPAGVNEGGQEEAPNFRFEIRFRNQTRNDMNSTDLTPSGAAVASRLVRRSAWEDSLFAPRPKALGTADMIFLGNTTDKVDEPFEGEETPFYISLLNASALEQPSELRKRERGDGVYPYPTTEPSTSDSRSSNSTSPTSTPDEAASTAASSKIPRPLLTTNGRAAPAQLYPLAHAQPLRLFDRGQDSEHYGFYTYFDRSVFISSSDLTTSDNSTVGSNGTATTAPEHGNAVCTFSQTRLHMQIWTRKGAIAALGATTAAGDGVPAGNSTANLLTPPGSFPYPVTITLDRHGGDAGKKGVYCYGVDEERHVLVDAKAWIAEDRAFGGSIVHAAAVPGGAEKRDDGGSGVQEGRGVDGGDGGCACSWRNWEGK